MWGVIPAAGSGTRIQPLAFSKELLPVGSYVDNAIERPRAVSEYLVERMTLGGATKLCFVINSAKHDILEYFGGSNGDVAICYSVQPSPLGFCDAIFRALPVISENEPVLFGLPDTIWFPKTGFQDLPNDRLSFLLFPVATPELFDAVVTDDVGTVIQVRVKQAPAVTKWVWGAFKMPGSVFHDLHQIWIERQPRDEYLGTLVNEYLRLGGTAVGLKTGTDYVDLGTLHGYREATRLLERRAASLLAETAVSP